jgi:N-acetylmuramoyl-L-alanine amidase
MDYAGLHFVLGHHPNRNPQNPVMKPLVAICIGHSRKINGRLDGGAVAADGTSEWTYNSSLAPAIAATLASEGVASILVDDYDGGSYGASMRWLAGHLRSANATVAIELHFNSATPTARGHEWLYWHSSAMGRLLAEELDSAMREALPLSILPARGAKPRNSRDRGAEFLRLTHCPAVIAEPFFGSNKHDWNVALDHRAKIAAAIAGGILEWLDDLR